MLRILSILAMIIVTMTGCYSGTPSGLSTDNSLEPTKKSGKHVNFSNTELESFMLEYYDDDKDGNISKTEIPNNITIPSEIHLKKGDLTFIKGAYSIKLGSIDDLSDFQGMKELGTLEIEYCRDVNFKLLSKNKSLSNINIQKADNTENEDELRNFKYLSSFGYGGLPNITPKLLKSIKSLDSIIINFPCIDKDISFLADMKKVGYIIMNQMPETFDGYNIKKEYFKNVDELEISNSEINSGEFLRYFNTNGMSLYFENCSIESLKTDLNHSFKRIDFTRTDVKECQYLSASLIYFNLCKVDFNELKKWDNLYDLRLDYCDILSFNEIENCKNLQDLAMLATTNEDVTPIAKVKKLNRFQIVSPIWESAHDMSPLLKSKSLKKIWLLPNSHMYKEGFFTSKKYKKERENFKKNGIKLDDPYYSNSEEPYTNNLSQNGDGVKELRRYIDNPAMPEIYWDGLCVFGG